MIRVILWDIDGTLLNFKEAEKHALRKCFDLFGLGDCPDEMLARYSAVNAQYWRRLERGELTREDVLHGRFFQFFREEGLECRDVPAFNAQYQESLGDTIFFNDGGYDLVKGLRTRVRQYAVTNGTLAAQERKLARSGLDRLLDGVFISEKVGADKPSRAFFDAVRKEIGPYRQDEVMIVGDSLTSDMQGGVNAGIVCCWYNPGREENTSGLKLQYEIQNLQQVSGIVPF